MDGEQFVREEEHDFQKVGDLLAGAVVRLFERVKQRKIEEFMEQIKNAKQNGKNKGI